MAKLAASQVLEDPFPTARRFKDVVEEGLFLAAEARAAKWRLENSGKVTAPRAHHCECGQPSFFHGLCRACAGWSL